MKELNEKEGKRKSNKNQISTGCEREGQTNSNHSMNYMQNSTRKWPSSLCERFGIFSLILLKNSKSQYEHNYMYYCALPD